MKASFKKMKILFGRKGRLAAAGQAEAEMSRMLESEALLDGFMSRNKPYLLRRYSLYQLSEESGIPLAELTIILDKCKNIGFKDFIDSYRIGYCKEFLERIPPSKISLFDLSIICGYDDQKEFCLAFRKAMGMPVSAYVRKFHGCRLSGSRLSSIHLFTLLLVAIMSLHILKYYHVRLPLAGFRTENKEVLLRGEDVKRIR